MHAFLLQLMLFSSLATITVSVTEPDLQLLLFSSSATITISVTVDKHILSNN